MGIDANGELKGDVPVSSPAATFNQNGDANPVLYSVSDGRRVNRGQDRTRRRWKTNVRQVRISMAP